MEGGEQERCVCCCLFVLFPLFEELPFFPGHCSSDTPMSWSDLLSTVITTTATPSFLCCFVLFYCSEFSSIASMKQLIEGPEWARAQEPHSCVRGANLTPWVLQSCAFRQFYFAHEGDAGLAQHLTACQAVLLPTACSSPCRFWSSLGNTGNHQEVRQEGVMVFWHLTELCMSGLLARQAGVGMSSQAAGQEWAHGSARWREQESTFLLGHPGLLP